MEQEATATMHTYKGGKHYIEEHDKALTDTICKTILERKESAIQNNKLSLTTSALPLQAQEEDFEADVTVYINHTSKPNDGNQSPTAVLSFDNDDSNAGQQKQSSDVNLPTENKANKIDVSENQGACYEDGNLKESNAINKEAVLAPDTSSNQKQIHDPTMTTTTTRRSPSKLIQLKMMKRILLTMTMTIMVTKRRLVWKMSTRRALVILSRRRK